MLGEGARVSKNNRFFLPVVDTRDLLEDPLRASDTESTGDGASTLALIPMGRVNQSPKQRVPMTPQNGDIVTRKKN